MAHLVKIGNSQGIRIPKPLIEQARLEGKDLQLQVVEGSLLITPRKSRAKSEGLADGRPDFLATGQEWKTPPLWGIGYTKVVNGHTFFLHDGRARDLMEAILWHSGEAESAKEYFRKLSFH